MGVSILYMRATRRCIAGLSSRSKTSHYEQIGRLANEAQRFNLSDHVNKSSRLLRLNHGRLVII